MSILWKNNATSALASDITAGSLSITVTTGHGDRFPEVVAPHYCMVTLVDTSGNREIVKVTSRASASNTMVIERAQEGTSARAFDEGSIVELRITKNAMDEVSKASDINAQHYVCDASAADQGATANSNSLKSIVDALGATEEATIELPHTGTGDTTTYTVGTDLTIPDTVRLIPHKGVRISPSTGVTLTANFEAGAYQIFAGDGTVTVNSYPQDQAWWGSTQRMDMKGLDVTALSIGTKTLALDANTTVSSFAATVLDDADATTARITLGMNQNVYPEDYGAIGDGVTDDSSAIQACFDAVQAMTYRPKIVFKSAKYHIHTGLTIPYAQGMWLAGTGGFYTPQAAGYTDKVTTLDYSGNGVALTSRGRIAERHGACH